MKEKEFYKTALIMMGIVIIFFIVFLASMDTTVTTTVDLKQEQIISKDGNHYILFDDRKLKLNDNFKKKIELDTYNKYDLTFSYNRLFFGRGEVLSIEIYGKETS